MWLTRSPLLVVCALGLGACGGDASPAVNVSSEAPAAAAPVSVQLSPSHGHRHQRFTAIITTRRRTGVEGKTRTNYAVAAMAVRPAEACVNDRDRRFPDRPAGARVRAVLDPARGEGGPAGWCPGRYRGTVTYFEGFACSPKGTCHPPRGYPTRTQVVARFSFRVR